MFSHLNIFYTCFVEIWIFAKIHKATQFEDKSKVCFHEFKENNRTIVSTIYVCLIEETTGKPYGERISWNWARDSMNKRKSFKVLIPVGFRKITCIGCSISRSILSRATINIHCTRL